MRTAIFVIQMASSILLILSILTQSKGAGLGEAFGGSNSFYTTKRGPEKVLFIATIVFVVIFFVSSFLLAII